MRLLLTSVAALGLLAAPAVAQSQDTTAGTGESSGTNAATAAADGTASNAAADEEARDRAMRNAEGAGMRDVTVLDRVFVVQGTTPQGETVFMIVNPPGALIGLGTPTGAGSGQSGGTAGGSTGQNESGATGGSASDGTGAAGDASGENTGNQQQ